LTRCSTRNSRYAYNYSLIWGGVDEIRAYAAATNDAGQARPGPDFDFAAGREHFTPVNCLRLRPAT